MNRIPASVIAWRFIVAAAASIAFATSTTAAELLEDIVEKSLPLGPSGTFVLHGIDGSAQIYGSERNELKIVAIKRAFSPARLNGIHIEIDAKDGAVNITTTAPAKPRWGLSDRSGTVDYIINLPQTARIASIDLPNGELVIEGMRGGEIAASLGSGRLATHNCFCDQKMRVENGGLDVVFDWLEEKPLSIEATIDNGNARVLIPADASFELHAASEHGRVASDFSEIENRKRGGVSEIQETIGQAPLSKLRMRAVHGNIHVSEVIW
jgi:hypothetical protein